MNDRKESSYSKLVYVNDDHTKTAMELQVLTPDSKYDGGIMDPLTGIPRPNHGGSAAVMASWACSYTNPDSIYSGSEELLGRMVKLAHFLMNRQHPDGTITLGSTNYHSPPDTAFVVVGLSQVCRLLELSDDTRLLPVIEPLRTFLDRAVPAMLTGGCHTPNHRWVLTAALGLLHERYGNPRLLERAEQWLAEGMDVTADGEWTERSNGIYNAVSDMMLYHAARTMNRPELLEPVRRNLRMMTYLIHPDGDVVTDYSGRQDFGEKSDLSSYMPVSRLMAWNDQDGLLAAMADAAAEATRHPGSVNNHAMLNILLYPEVCLDGIARVPLPNAYEVVLNEHHPIASNLMEYTTRGTGMSIRHSSAHTSFGSPLVRYREGADSVTVMTRNPSFLAMRHGEAHLLGTKLTTAFLPGLVQFEGFERTTNGYRLSTVMHKGYVGPIPEPTKASLSKDMLETSPWYLLPHGHRPVTHLQEHRVEAEISRYGNRWEIQVRTDEAEDLFTQLTLLLGPGGELTGDGLKSAGTAGHSFLACGTAEYRVGLSGFRISTGAHEHRVSVLRNDKLPGGCLALSINWMTPVHRTVAIECLNFEEEAIHRSF